MGATSPASPTDDPPRTSDALSSNDRGTLEAAVSKAPASADGSARVVPGRARLWSLEDSEWLKLASPLSPDLSFSIVQAEIWCEMCVIYHPLTQLRTGVTHDGRTLQCSATGRHLFWFPRAKSEAVVLSGRALTSIVEREE